MDEGRNEGVNMTGGTINAGNIAVGRGSTAKSESPQLGREDVAERLEELLRQLEAHRDAVPDDVHTDTGVVQEELAKEQPDKKKVLRFLKGISESVKTVTGLTTAADDLLEAVSLAF
jgi:hypothetical protein